MLPACPFIANLSSRVVSFFFPLLLLFSFLFFFSFATDMAHALFRRLINVRVSKLITCYLTDTLQAIMRSNSSSCSSTPEPSFFVEVVCVTNLYKVYRDFSNFQTLIYILFSCVHLRERERERETREKGSRTIDIYSRERERGEKKIT